MTIQLDLLHFVKETQLQHGLRAENFARYHAYLTNRVATLRRQLNLSNDKKKFLNREVTTATANDPRHLMLLALYAERCWAESESMTELILNAKRQESVKTQTGGIPPKEQPRKRLNKSVVWAAKLSEIAAGVADERTKTETCGYLAEAKGRCELSHGRFAAARDHFKEARKCYFSLQSTSNESQWPIVLAKVGELDDRVVYCMQCLGEDPMTYKPDLGGGVASQFAVTVTWNKRQLNIFSVKVKDCIREANRSDWEGTKQKSLEGSSPIAVGTQAKVLEVVDHVIGLYNDAVVQTRQDLRSASDSQRQELQLLVHYLSYHVLFYTLERTRYMIEVFERRYAATTEALRSQPVASSSTNPHNSKKDRGDFSAANYASPLEVARLYDAAMECIAEMQLLPGVGGRNDVEAWEQEFRGGKLYFAAESWLVAKDTSTALAQYREAQKVLSPLSSSPRARALLSKVEEALVLVTAECALQRQPLTITDKTSKYLRDSLEDIAVAGNVAKFPPDYQAVACKPVFVDIASTFIDYPPTSGNAAPHDTLQQQQPRDERGGVAVDAAATRLSKDDGRTQASAADPKKGWGWGWGWGKK